MRSKNWCCKFSWPLIRKDLTRFWPVWGSYLAIWLLILPIPMLTNRYASPVSLEQIMRDVHSQVVYAGGEASLAMTAIYGGLAAFAVWSYLYQSRSASMFHALPVTRETLFASHYTAGMTFLLVPNLFIAVVTYLCQATLGYFDPTQILCWLAMVCLESLLFFSLGTLAAMCTGNLPAMPVLYGLINFAVVLCESLLREFSTQLYWGVTSQDLKLTWFSPVIHLGQMLNYTYVDYPIYQNGVYYGSERIRYYDPEQFKVLGLYALAALVLVACSLLLYRRRTTESAGDVIAFDFLKPIAKYCFAFGCALVLGWMLQEVIFPWSVGVLPRLFCSALGGAIGYLTASMLLKKSFRVFRPRELAGLLALWVALGGLFAAFDADLFGVEAYVPRAGEVTKVSISSDYQLTLTLPQDIDPVLALHRDILDHKDELQMDDLLEIDSPNRSTVSVRFTYTLEDGSTVRRNYSLPWDTETAYDRNSPQGQLETIMNVPQRLVDSYLPPKDATIASMQLQIGDDQMLLKAGEAFSGHYSTAYVNDDHFDLLLAAMEDDIRAGRLRAWNKEALVQKDYRHLFSIEINYDPAFTPDTAESIAGAVPIIVKESAPKEASKWLSVPVYSYDNPTRTMELLVKLGYFTGIPSGYFTEGGALYE